MDTPSPQPFDAKAFLKNLTTLPGVYRMLDERGVVLYVGKARQLRKGSLVRQPVRAAALNWRWVRWLLQT